MGHGSARLQSSPSSNSFTCRTWGRCSSSKSREWKVQLKINAIFFSTNQLIISLNSLLPFTSRYLGPLISRRQAGDLRKRAIIRGTFGQFSYPAGMIAHNPYFVNLSLGVYHLKWNLGGWDPAWDEEKKMFIMKPYKGHKRERDRESRLGISVSPILFIFQHFKSEIILSTILNLPL